MRQGSTSTAGGTQVVIKALKPTGRKLLAFKAFPHLREIVLLVSAYFLSVFTRAIIHGDARTIAFENSESGLTLEAITIRATISISTPWVVGLS